MPGQRSFDASRLFGRRRERGEPRRAVSEDQRGQSEDAGDLDGNLYTVGQKIKKSPGKKKLVKSNKSQFFFVKLHFCQFSQFKN